MNTPKTPTTARMIFAQNLRLARKLKDLSQEALGLEAGLSRAYVSQIEKGARNVSIDNMGLLADALGIPLKTLVDPETSARLKEQLGDTEKE